MTRNRRSWSVALVCCVASCSEPALVPRASDAEAVSASSSSLQGGEIDFRDRAAVGVITLRANERLLCSGALLSSKVVLTARHCIAEQPPSPLARCGDSLGANARPSAIEVTTAVSIDSSLPDDGGASHSVEGIHVMTGDDWCGFDLAWLVLRAPIAAAEAAPFVPRWEQPSSREIYSAIGHGATCGDAADERCFLESGIRRRIDGLSVACAGDDCPRGGWLAPSEWVGERGPCLGDSGGAALDASGRLIGISVRGVIDDAGRCTTPVYAGLAELRGLLETTESDAAVTDPLSPIEPANGTQDGGERLDLDAGAVPVSSESGGYDPSGGDGGREPALPEGPCHECAVTDADERDAERAPADSDGDSASNGSSKEPSERSDSAPGDEATERGLGRFDAGPSTRAAVDAGCSCRVSRRRESMGFLGWMVLLGLTPVARRLRRLRRGAGRGPRR